MTAYGELHHPAQLLCGILCCLMVCASDSGSFGSQADPVYTSLLSCFWCILAECVFAGGCSGPSSVPFWLWEATSTCCCILSTIIDGGSQVFPCMKHASAACVAASYDKSSLHTLVQISAKSSKSKTLTHCLFLEPAFCKMHGNSSGLA